MTKKISFILLVLLPLSLIVSCSYSPSVSQNETSSEKSTVTTSTIDTTNIILEAETYETNYDYEKAIDLYNQIPNTNSEKYALAQDKIKELQEMLDLIPYIETAISNIREYYDKVAEASVTEIYVSSTMHYYTDDEINIKFDNDDVEYFTYSEQPYSSFTTLLDQEHVCIETDSFTIVNWTTDNVDGKYSSKISELKREVFSDSYEIVKSWDKLFPLALLDIKYTKTDIENIETSQTANSSNISSTNAAENSYETRIGNRHNPIKLGNNVELSDYAAGYPYTASFRVTEASDDTITLEITVNSSYRDNSITLKNESEWAFGSFFYFYYLTDDPISFSSGTATMTYVKQSVSIGVGQTQKVELNNNSNKYLVIYTTLREDDYPELNDYDNLTYNGLKEYYTFFNLSN